MVKDYLTIAEFAEKVGISKQAVYKQLNNQLKPFVQLVENKKCLKIEALELYEVNQVEQPNSTTLIDLAEHLQKQYDTLTRLVDILRDDIDIKNKQIKDLSLNLTFNQQLLNQQQQLNAGTLLTAQSSDQYDKGYQDAKNKYFAEMKKTAHILNEKYPEAVDYLIEEIEKSGE